MICSDCSCLERQKGFYSSYSLKRGSFGNGLAWVPFRSLDLNHRRRGERKKMGSNEAVAFSSTNINPKTFHFHMQFTCKAKSGMNEMHHSFLGNSLSDKLILFRGINKREKRDRNVIT